MHLSECIDLINSPDRLDYSAAGECTRDWIFKSTTEFYGWDDRLQQSVLFGLLCWSYTMAGIVMLIIQPSWTAKSSFPYRTFAYTLIFLQGPLSFWADYVSMTKDSYIHVLDRIMAIINCSMQSWKVCTISFYSRPSILICQICAITFAFFCFLNSQASQQAQDPNSFLFWHNAWHCFPFVGIAIEVYEFLYLGEYNSEKHGSIFSAVRSKQFYVDRLLKHASNSLMPLQAQSDDDEVYKEKKV